MGGRGSSSQRAGTSAAIGGVLGERDASLRERTGAPRAIASRTERRLRSILSRAEVGTTLAIHRTAQFNPDVMEKREDGWHHIRSARRNLKQAVYTDSELARIASSATRIEEALGNNR